MAIEKDGVTLEQHDSIHTNRSQLRTFFTKVKAHVGDGPAATTIGRDAYQRAIALGLDATAAVNRNGRESALTSFEELGTVAVPGFAYWVHGYVFQSLVRGCAPRQVGAGGVLIGALALTEPTGGSDLNAVLTTAREVDGGYLLSGRKHFISLGSIADVLVVSAKLHEGTVGLFLVDTDQPSVSRTPIRTDYAMRGLDLCDIALNEAYCAKARCIAHEATIPLLRALSMERFIAAVVAGAMLDTVVGLIRAELVRVRPGASPLHERQAIRLAFSEAAIRAKSVTTLLDVQKARFLDGKRLDFAEVAECKHEATQALRAVAALLVEVSGARGVTGNATPLRLLGDAYAQCTYGGTSNVMKEIVAGRAIHGAKG